MKRKTWMDKFFANDIPLDWRKVRAGGVSDSAYYSPPRNLRTQPPAGIPSGDWNGLITEEEVRRASKK